MHRSTPQAAPSAEHRRPPTPRAGSCLFCRYRKTDPASEAAARAQALRAPEPDRAPAGRQDTVSI